MNEQQETFHATGEWTPPPPAMVSPVGWFSRLLWPFMRYRAYGTGRTITVTVMGGGGGGGVGPTTSDGAGWGGAGINEPMKEVQP